MVAARRACFSFYAPHVYILSGGRGRRFFISIFFFVLWHDVVGEAGFWLGLFSVSEKKKRTIFFFGGRGLSLS